MAETPFQVQLKRVKKESRDDNKEGLEKVDLKSRRSTIDEQIKQRRESKAPAAKDEKPFEMERGEKTRRDSIVRVEASGRVLSKEFDFSQPFPMFSFSRTL